MRADAQITEEVEDDLSDSLVYKIHEYEDGSRYDGEFKGQARHGYGTMIFKDKGVYRGFWKDNKMHGKGIFVGSDGFRYEGQWSDNTMIGIGSKAVDCKLDK